MPRKKRDPATEVEYRVYPKPDTVSPLEDIIEKKLRRILESDSDPEKNTLTAINTAIKFVAVKHKISEADWGEAFKDFDDEGNTQPEEKTNESDGNGNGGEAG